MERHMEKKVVGSYHGKEETNEIVEKQRETNAPTRCTTRKGGTYAYR